MDVTETFLNPSTNWCTWNSRHDYIYLYLPGLINIIGVKKAPVFVSVDQITTWSMEVKLFLTVFRLLWRDRRNSIAHHLLAVVTWSIHETPSVKAGLTTSFTNRLCALFRIVFWSRIWRPEKRELPSSFVIYLARVRLQSSSFIVYLARVRLQ